MKDRPAEKRAQFEERYPEIRQSDLMREMLEGEYAIGVFRGRKQALEQIGDKVNESLRQIEILKTQLGALNEAVQLASDGWAITLPPRDPPEEKGLY